MNDFYQTPPELGNQYDTDPVLSDWVKYTLPDGVLKAVEPDLKRLGERAAGGMLAMAADAEGVEPRHVPYDPWGRRIDRIETARGWDELKRVAAEEGIVASAYERRHGEWSRVEQFLRLYLYHPSSAIYSCPLAMTDGAARVIEKSGDSRLMERAFPRLTTRDPARFWTSGQWMTERTGGSDVSGTSTRAIPDGDGFRLHGDKWFTSATTSEMALTLARVTDGDGEDRDLSLFYLELRDEQGRLDGIRINRLKDKMGTRALPTAELTLSDVPARMVGERGRGVATIATILNITRLYNSCCAVGYMRRGLALATDYARRRKAFGKRLIELPLHRATLGGLAAELDGGFALVMFLAQLLGRDETGVADERDRALLRLLTPVTKLYTGKQAVRCISEMLECFGGAGYVEDTGLPVLLRDAQVLTIWEGTTNVLSLDMVRALSRGEAGRHLVDWFRETAPHGGSAGREADELAQSLDRFARLGETEMQVSARPLAYRIAEACIRTLLAARAARGSARADTAVRWWQASAGDPGGWPVQPDVDTGMLLDREWFSHPGNS